MSKYNLKIQNIKEGSIVTIKKLTEGNYCVLKPCRDASVPHQYFNSDMQRMASAEKHLTVSRKTTYEGESAFHVQGHQWVYLIEWIDKVVEY